MDLTRIVQEFEENGYAVIEDFLTDEEVRKMKDEITRLTDEYDPNEFKSVFTTLQNKRNSDDYFMNSADKIRYFLEEGVLDSKGELNIDKHMAINKIGHALHWKNEIFKKVSFSNKVKEIVRNLGFKDPAIVQGMYIFKNAGRGGEVTPHQDATFLYNEPQKLVGVWFPLEDATEQNGCLWFQPGSHKGKLYCRWVRNTDPDGPAMKMVDYGIAEAYHDEDKFVAAPVKKGSCVLIHGLVIHKSCKNVSKFSRPAFTVHIFEQSESVYSEKNWLQPTREMAFPSLYDN